MTRMSDDAQSPSARWVAPTLAPITSLEQAEAGAQMSNFEGVLGPCDGFYAPVST